MKNTTNLARCLFTLALITLSAGSVLAASDSSPRGVSAPAPVTIENVGDPGTSFTVSSIALDDATHFTLVAGGSCAAPPFALNAGDSCTQFVVFDPQAVGPLECSICWSPAMRVRYSTTPWCWAATVRPDRKAELTIAPDPMDFGLVAAADLPDTDTFTISNTGDPGTSFDITGLVLTGASEFSIISQTCLGSTLNDGDACSVTIEFDAAVDGMFMGQLEVQTSIGSGTADIQGATQIPAQLAFVVQPSDTVVNQAIVPSVIVEVQDSSGTLVSLDSTRLSRVSSIDADRYRQSGRHGLGHDPVRRAGYLPWPRA